MVGSVDGYHWIPKWLRSLYCFQSVKKKKEEKKKALNTLRAHSLFCSVTASSPMMLWIYGGAENIHIPDGGSNMARFSSLSIVPLLTAPKALKGVMGKGLPVSDLE